MKLFPRLILACLALSSSLMGGEPVLHKMPDLDVAQVDERMAELSIVHFGNDVNQLNEMEVNEKSIQSILQNKEDQTEFPSINAPIVIRSMEEAAKHLNRASMEKLDLDFSGEQLVIFAWKGSDKDKFYGCYRQPNWREADFCYISAGQMPRHKHDDLFANKAGAEKPKPDQQLIQTAVFVLANHTQIRVRQLSNPFGRVIGCESW